MGDSTTRRSTVVEKFVKRSGWPSEEETEDNRDSLREIRPAVATPMLDVILKDGTVESFSYSHLRRVIFRPGDTLILKFIDGTTVLVDGRNLRQHRQQIRLHRADKIQEGTEGEEGLKSEDAAHISSIEITEGEEL